MPVLPEPPFADAPLDFAAMRRRNRERLGAQLWTVGAAAAWLLAPGNVRYVAGSALLPADAGRGIYQRCSALLSSDGDVHLFTPHPELAPAELAADRVHPPLYLESEAGLEDALKRVLELFDAAPRNALAIDELSLPLRAALERQGIELRDAAPLVGAAKLIKSDAEIECIRRAQRINEVAMGPVQAALRSGLRQCDLSGLFFRGIYALGASANGIDPIWQVMPPSRADGPFTSHGDVAFPTCSTDRPLREGDVVWVDTGIEYHGYQSDFGRTFVVDRRPDPRQLAQGRRWLEVVEAVLEAVRPGVDGLELARRARSAAGNRRPWLEHFYLIHGVGTEPAEPPFVGTDLGETYDERLVLEPGMVLVLEPVIWDDGRAGYRAEEIVAVTGDGYRRLSDYTYAPYEQAMGG